MFIGLSLSLAQFMFRSTGASESYAPAFDFSDARNSMFIALLAQDF